jgi:NADPH-dependent 2,4-dienoyl-CoA reductase/sulfur reductase-like enzyme
MGTRSGIGIENPNTGVIKAVYCHWDGYLSHNGSILNKHYDSSPKVNNLIALGDISSLKPEIGEKHAFSQFELRAEEVAGYKLLTENWCTFYGRDRGETGTEYKRFETRKDFVNGIDAEYFYLFVYDEDLTAGKWFYKKYNETAWKRLSKALSKIAEEELA